jgi:glycosyltransferase involved in cell wall biosynthesis
VKKKILFSVVHRKDRSPSQRFRFEQYLDILKDNGFEVEFLFLLNPKDDKAFYSKGNYFKKLIIVLKSIVKLLQSISKSYDIVFVQRESFFLGTVIFEKIYSKKAWLVYDFDDSIWLSNVSEANKKLSFLKNANKTKELISFSNMVFAGNEYLAQYARQYNTNVKIVPTTIDTEEYKRIPQPQREKICIGWSGSITTIQHFEYAIPALKIIKEKYKNLVYFKVIGDANYKNDDLGVIGLPWVKDTEIEDLSEIEIGIMPLPDDEWSKGKCGLKGLQYMALGIATLMSPVGVNDEIIQHGKNGFLPKTVDDWVSQLSLLIEDKNLRESVAKAGRKTVVEKYSVMAWKDSYIKFLKEL